MRACTWCGVAALALSIATTVQWPADARQAPAQAVPPTAAGGRGPNPIPGLAGLVETPSTGPDAPRFEVASVKRNQLGAGGGNPSGSRSLAGGAVRTTNATLRMLVRTAYRLGLRDEIVGGPPWIDTYGFDVDARPAKPVTLAESAYMMRTLLADRFKLVARKESREGPVYALVLARRDGALGPQINRPAGECVMTVPAFARGDANASTPAMRRGTRWRHDEGRFRDDDDARHPADAADGSPRRRQDRADGDVRLRFALRRIGHVVSGPRPRHRGFTRRAVRPGTGVFDLYRASGAAWPEARIPARRSECPRRGRG